MLLGALRLNAGPEVGIIPIKEWRGELMQTSDGAMYWRTRFSGFRKDVSSQTTVVFYNIIQQKNIIISQAQSPIDRFPREMWRVPSGKYSVDRIELVDGMGVRRTWLRPQSANVLIVVPKNMLSNLGIWTVMPDGPTGLKVQFSPAKNVYSEEGPKSDSSIAAVVNGFTGIVQEVYGGNKVKVGAVGNDSDSSQMRGVMATTRQISMTYKLDLLIDNAQNRDVLLAINGFDGSLRGCYSRAVNGNQSLRGNIVFKILISEKTGTIRSIKRSGGSLVDGGLTDCLATELMQIPLPSRKNMIGELTFSFDMTQT